MKGNCNYQPENRIVYGTTGAGQVLWNIERNDREEGSESIENWDYDYVEVSDFDRDTIVAAVVRSEYSQNAIDGIIANADSNPLAYLRYHSLKAGNKYTVDANTDTARVYVRYLLDSHRELLEADSDVQINVLSGI